MPVGSNHLSARLSFPFAYEQTRWKSSSPPERDSAPTEAVPGMPAEIFEIARRLDATLARLRRPAEGIERIQLRAGSLGRMNWRPAYRRRLELLERIRILEDTAWRRRMRRLPQWRFAESD